ncbi:Potassium efflux system KefA protein / Small-conductance mechanosensitive channel [Sphingobium indicum BiD32]|uniref:Potassium efflux system KefA protein / Small-conductance mechanosensitive channel n=1 Tax=Sphingobium indicum BiD32 TaxID=1301087 RepID=N1MVN0_9SPHN|nr:Potassium efflux system KefA protein / Small-conductance mechanosensitive channel [Sphingobium indicum BiD32]
MDIGADDCGNDRAAAPDPGKLDRRFGIGTIAIGFAFQDFFQNFLAGILIRSASKDAHLRRD